MLAGSIAIRVLALKALRPGAQKSDPMFVPSGYVLIREALNRVGRELFPSQWTGEEHKARSRPDQ